MDTIKSFSVEHEVEAAVEAINRNGMLDRADRLLQGLSDGLFERLGVARRPILNFLHGTWFGHPLHPVMTDIPIGAWTATLVLDAASLVTRYRGLTLGADVTLALGLAGAAGAATAGLADWRHTDGAPRRTGLMHAILNGSATIAFLLSGIARWQHARGLGQGLAWLGYGAMLVAAYLGGNLVYRHRLGTDHAERPDHKRRYAAVLAEGDLEENHPKRVELNGVGVVLLRQDGTIYALGDVCSHLGGPLSEGSVDGASIVCPWHASCFSLADGHVIEGPAVHPQPRYDVRIHEGQIEIR